MCIVQIQALEWFASTAMLSANIKGEDYKIYDLYFLVWELLKEEKEFGLYSHILKEVYLVLYSHLHVIIFFDKPKKLNTPSILK